MSAIGKSFEAVLLDKVKPYKTKGKLKKKKNVSRAQLTILVDISCIYMSPLFKLKMPFNAFCEINSINLMQKTSKNF